MIEQLDLFREDDEYIAFTEKFKPKKTTDDCYTPQAVYEAVKNWACKEYDIDPATIVRPFWPGGDYERYNYPEGCVVLDNPPFSILSRICEFYLEKNVDFFLFVPSLTAFNGKMVTERLNHLVCNASIIYENGANVNTSFVTTFGDEIARTAPSLRQAIMDAQKVDAAPVLPKYEYPNNVLTAAMVGKYSTHGVDFRVLKADAKYIAALDNQRSVGKAIFGGGYLLSERAAAERAAAERAAAEKRNVIIWELSEREKIMVKALGGVSDG